MAKPIILQLNKAPLSERIIQHFPRGEIYYRQFPDAESYLQLKTKVKNRDIIIVESLSEPNNKILPLLFLAKTARDCGAKRVGLIAPYLAYMRQDSCFQQGECVSAKYFAEIISHHFDWLMTIEPHLHRINDLQQIFTIPTYNVSATQTIATWIKKTIKQPLIVGPDAESELWVSNIAAKLAAPFVIGKKIRKGDRKVTIRLPMLKAYQNYTPVIIDDIISTGQTVIETMRQLNKQRMRIPLCVAIHALFIEPAYKRLLAMRPQRIVTCNTILHQTNNIDLSAPVIAQVKAILKAQ